MDQGQVSAQPYIQVALAGGASAAAFINPCAVETAEWVRLKCRYGCGMYGRCRTCPPHSPTADETRRVLAEYSVGVLLHGPDQPALRALAADLERRAFLDGFHKSFSYHAGPCSLCDPCDPTQPCRNPSRARPAMEAAGIDVFATARAAGMQIEVLPDHDAAAGYYALLLLC